MPLQRKLPKRGFTNEFKVRARIVNVGDIAEAFKAGEVADPATLAEKGFREGRKGPVKVLGNGDVKSAITVKANFFSKAAIDKIKAAGGTAEVV